MSDGCSFYPSRMLLISDLSSMVHFLIQLALECVSRQISLSSSMASVDAICDYT